MTQCEENTSFPFNDPAFSVEILTCVKGLLMIMDGQGRVVWVNPYTDHQFRGKLDVSPPPLIWDLFQEPDSTHIRHQFTGLCAGATNLDFECTLRDSKERTLTYSCFLYSQRGEDASPKWVVLLGRDITAEKRHEEEQCLIEQAMVRAQKIQSISTLAKGVAHDFSQIMATILTHSTMAQSLLPKSHPSNEILGLVREAATNAVALAEAVSVFAESDGSEKELVALNDLMAHTIRVLKTLPPAGTRFSDDVQEALPLVRANPHQLRQALSNLCMNAFEAVSHGSGEVCLSAQLVHMNEEYCRPCGPCLEKKIGPFACIEVRDNGVGMSLDQKKRAFEPYFSTKGKGRGLGLSVAWGIVREHGGCMVIDSGEGEGTSVRIHIPVAKTGATAAEKIPVTLG